MKQLEITYRPVPFLPWHRTATGSHPENWEEVTPVQLQAIGKTIIGSPNDVEFLQALTGIKRRIIKKLDSYQRFKIGELLEFFHQTNPHNSFIIKKIKQKHQVYAAPMPKLKGMSFGQFVYVDTFFGNYQEEKKAEELNRFLAALYLPEGKPFDENLIDENAPLMEQLAAQTREAIILNYMMLKQWLIKVYPLLFVIPEDNEEPETRKLKPETRKHDPQIWIKTFENLVGDDIVNNDKYAAIPVHNVLRYMSRKIKENMKKKK